MIKVEVFKSLGTVEVEDDHHCPLCGRTQGVSPSGNVVYGFYHYCRIADGYVWWRKREG